MRIVRYDAGTGPRYGELVDGTVHEWREGRFGSRQRSGRTHAAALAGFCSNVRVVLHADGSCTVVDDGRGGGRHPAAGRPLEVRSQRPARRSRLAHVIPAAGREGDGEWISD